MELGDLTILLEEIRQGREEDTATEWKRQWWNFKVESQAEEFARDIAAMANARTNDARAIVVGIGNNGQLHAAALPADEADLQRRLDKIDPLPHVTFTTCSVEGTTLSIIEIHPPFDVPYVVTHMGKNIIFYRQGSSIRTASRAILDRWYNERKGQAELHIAVSGQDVAKNAVVRSPRPFHRPVVPESISDPILRMMSTSIGGETDPVAEADFENRDVWFQISLVNEGTIPATNLVLDLQISNVEDIRLWNNYSRLLSMPAPRRWQLDPSQNSYVDRFGLDENSDLAFVRQRTSRINPDTEEFLVKVGLTARRGHGSTPPPIEASYRLTSEQGEVLKGSFTLQIVFDGEVEVKPRPRGPF